MIIEQILNGLKNLILWFLDLIPEISLTPDLVGSIDKLNELTSILFFFTTKPVGVALILTATFWIVGYPTFSLIKFIYTKIPGVS